ncbi:alanine/ornithine racemase family PLP-dependent enzyme [Spirulina major CS-329]|uniref:alanine/ornithine racemase family PLP-dependent enzyme n=1 Tax=Spirulina TaxID=1154 RepID=UPI0023310B4F|nr:MULTISPECIES: alanine/ornithine racemase family PLP-dependent enzyme [Spirulina]MDB9495702.1 alanine/ornithine racemase family PLP-dependent enzyme [Spirulina subsalsa CS-330]MDB9504343.1 alanine/ornithine racemase family PLP-dependent enzyme [Spirulina major CS-329]
MPVILPRIEITLSQIQHNARILSERYGKQGISLMGVSKATLGDPEIAKAMIQGGVKFIADSRIENIKRMKNAGISTRFVLLRTALSQAESVIKHVDISLNTELATVRELSYYARMYNTVHQIIIMIELGDLREGVLPGDLFPFIQEVLTLPKIKIIGIGCNLACFGGIKPDNYNMGKLSHLADAIEQRFQITLEIVSGGNSANYEWAESTQALGRINNLRLGESILLGCETIQRKAIPGLHTSAFTLITEVIESKIKPSVPFGEMGQDAFGTIPTFQDRGLHHRVIIALGRQDILVSGLISQNNLEILGSSSDHIILDSHNHDCKIGSEVKFDLDYGGLLSAMTSPFIAKQVIGDRAAMRRDRHRVF